jgi:hypothetical protein
VLGEGRGGGVVEEECGGELEVGGRGELVAQLDRHEGVEAELLEGAVRLDCCGRGMTENSGSVGVDELQEGALPLRLRKGRETEAVFIGQVEFGVEKGVGSGS